MAFLTDLKDGMDNDVLQPPRARGRFLCSNQVTCIAMSAV